MLLVGDGAYILEGESRYEAEVECVSHPEFDLGDTAETLPMQKGFVGLVTERWSSMSR
jgi:hypothetical protein